MTIDELQNKIGISKKNEILKSDVVKKHGGARENAGKKLNRTLLVERGFKDWIDKHAKEVQKITLTDPRTGKTVTVKKTRLVIVLEKLYELAVEGSHEAADKWLNRILGRPLQPIGGDDDHPILLHIDF